MVIHTLVVEAINEVQRTFNDFENFIIKKEDEGDLIT